MIAWRSAALTFVIALCESAHAADEGEPIRVAVSAPDACMDAPRFFSQVQARTSRARAAMPSEQARLFNVLLSLEPPGSRGTLIITGVDGKSLVREVPGATCEEVASALALIAALAIDPNARTTPIIVPAASSSSAPAPLPAPAPPPAPAPAPQPPTFIVMPSPTQVPQPGLQVNLGLGGEVMSGVAPKAAWAGALWWDLYRAQPWKLLRFALVRTASVKDKQDGGTVKLSLTAARIEGCPIGAMLGTKVSARGCARVEAGVLTADAVVASGAQAVSRAWIGAGAIGALGWEPVSGFGIEGHFGLSMPFVRDRFVWYDGSTVHHVPAVQVSGGIGMVVHFL